MTDFLKEREKAREGGVHFLQSEVDTGLTLADIALETEDPEKRRRNLRNARAAYDSILHFADRVFLTGNENQALAKQLESLKTKLIELGEKFD